MCILHQNANEMQVLSATKQYDLILRNCYEV